MATSEEVVRLGGVSRATVSRALNGSARISDKARERVHQYTVPSLTTARQDRMAMGRKAVQRLIALIEGPEEACPLILPTQLIVRRSTGPVPKDLH